MDVIQRTWTTAYRPYFGATPTYYAKYAREDFVNYREVKASDDQALHELFLRAYNHSLWVLNKYSVDESTTDKLKKICST
ncbi:hypothetical protein ACFX13_045250 [Malus domestica]